MRARTTTTCSWSARAANPRGEFLSLLDYSAKSKGKVVILSQVQDNELAWYYQRALVTVFPVAACHLESSACPKMSRLSGGRGRGPLLLRTPDDFRGAYDLIKA